MTDAPPIDFGQRALILIAGLLVLRLIGLLVSPLNLHGDEAQYWAWAQDLDWGYFSKPPMIAWVIATTTTIFGDAEWAVRLSSPILHSFTAWVIFLIGRKAFDPQTGFWAAAVYILMPAVWLSSGIVSTDVPLLLCWAVALHAWVHLRDGAGQLRALQLGLAFGLGFLSKYAMLFFLPGLAIAIIIDSKTRQALLGGRGVLAVITALLCVSPNLMWNAANDFATVSHTAANANLQPGIPFFPLELGTFWLDQLAVFGPFTLILLIIALGVALSFRLSKPATVLAGFVLAPLVIISIQALISRANANWAVSAYVAGSLLTAYFCVTYAPRFKAWLKGGVSVQALLSLILVVVMLVPSLTNALGLANAVKRVRAWPETVSALKSVVDKGHEDLSFEAVAMDKRIIFYDLSYYGLDEAVPLRMWLNKSYPENQAEVTHPLPASDGPILIVNYFDKEYQDELNEDFVRLIPLDDLDIDLGGGKRRTLKLWAGYGYTPTQTR